MTILAPYLYAWSHDDRKSFKICNLKDIERDTALDAVTLAFLTSDTFEEIRSWIPEVRSFHGKVILSIGGACGCYPSINLSIDEEVRRLYSLILEGEFAGIDLDIEGKALENKKGLQKLVLIVKAVSDKLGVDYHISLTLPVEFDDGLSPQALRAVQLFKDEMVPVRIVNCMLMDYYTPLPRGSSWGKENKRILECSFRKLRLVYSEKSECQVWGMLGICPMIGYNDDNTIFSVDDWKVLLGVAYERKIGLVTFWALNRDQAVTSIRRLLKRNVNTYSHSQEKDLSYTKYASETLKGSS